MKLNYKKFGSGKPLVILHGLLGMLDNWQTVGKILSENYDVFLIDARNHGHSPHNEIFRYDAMADDLLEFINYQLPTTNYQLNIIGHSMGGKTAMKFALKFPEKVEKLVVVDIAPKFYPVHHDNILEALLAVDFTVVKSRKDVEEILAKYIPENYIRQFLLKNLFWKAAEQLAWRFNLDVIYKNLENIGEEISEGIFDKPTLFLKGEKSEYIAEDDFGLIKNLFPRAKIKTLPNAGHWIHAEQPELFVKTVSEFLKNDSLPTGEG